MTIAVVITLLLAAGLGVGIGLGGWTVVAVLGAATAGYAVLRRPFYGLVILIALMPIDAFLLLREGFTTVKLIGLAVFGAWLVRKLARRESWKAVLSTRFFAAALLFAVVVLASLLWARYPNFTRSGFISLAQLIALSLIVIDLTDSGDRLDVIAKVLVLGAAAASTLTIYQYLFASARRAGEDITGGINATAVLLVITLPMGFYLLRTARAIVWRLLGLAFVPLSIVAIVMTFSRFNLLLLPPTMLLSFLFAVREARSRPWLVGMVLVAAVGAMLWVPWDRLEERARSIEPYLRQTLQFGQTQIATSPRGYHLRVALAVARDNPILGVGYGNFGAYFLYEYQFQVTGADQLYGTVRSPHSTYLGIAADLGAVGLVMWLAVLGACVTGVGRAWRRSRAAGDRGMLAFVQAVALMLGLTMLAYSWYMPTQREKLFWLIFGLSIAVDRVSAPLERNALIE